MAESAENRIANVVSIAGVDPSGGAGLLADVKAISACGGYACGVVAALTAQNTKGVTGVLPVPAEFVKAQIDTLFEDVRIDAVKIGMLDRSDLIETVADALERYKPKYVVLDPVMIAKSGDRLLQEDALETLRDRLLPLATVLTPNLPEAAALLGRETSPGEDDFEETAKALWRLMKSRDAWVYLKGGHLESDRSDDLLVNGAVKVPFTAKRTETKNTHGTGCTLSSAIAAYLPQTGDVPEACLRAKAFITGAIEHADELEVGTGHGPTNHFWNLWPKVQQNVNLV